MHTPYTDTPMRKSYEDEQEAGGESSSVGKDEIRESKIHTTHACIKQTEGKQNGKCEGEKTLKTKG